MNTSAPEPPSQEGPDTLVVTPRTFPALATHLRRRRRRGYRDVTARRLGIVDRFRRF